MIRTVRITHRFLAGQSFYALGLCTLLCIGFFVGRYAWAFLPVLILGITAFVLLSRRSTRHLPAIQITASAMYVVAIFLKRYSLMAMGFAINPLGQYTAPYVPSLAEILIAAGLLAVGMLVMTLSAKLLPLRVRHARHRLFLRPAYRLGSPGEDRERHCRAQ